MEFKDCTENARYQLVLNQGEKVIETITTFCLKRGIRSGTLWGLGAVRNASVAFYALDTKEYRAHEFVEDHEVVSLVGNIAIVNEKPFMHAHISLGNAGMDVVGGHLQEAEVAVTLEIHLTAFNETFLRAMNDTIGLNLLNFKRPEL